MNEREARLLEELAVRGLFEAIRVLRMPWAWKPDRNAHCHELLVMWESDAMRGARARDRACVPRS
jgi:hypothetical protein